MSIETLTETILGKMSGMNKWRRDFLSHLFRLFLSMRGRYTFLNAERYGNFGEICYRQHFERRHDWATFNYHLIMQSTSAERINVFDPSYLSKSGRHTPGVGWHWSGCAGKAKWGLEIGAFSVVDVLNHTALHLVAEQTLKEETEQHHSLLEYYSSLVERHVDTLLKISAFSLGRSSPSFQQIPSPSAAAVSPTCCPRTAPTHLIFESKHHETASNPRIHRPVFYHSDHQRVEAPAETR